MAASGEGSVTRWIGDLKAGGDAAAQRLWERYFDRPVRLARQRLRAGRAAAEDEEDAALSAFHTFCRRITKGQYPDLADRDDLWRLLVVITLRKAFDQIQRQQAQKRGGGRLVGEADLESSEALDRFAGREPSPELAALVVEEYQRLWSRLGDDSLRQVLDLSLEGCTPKEIAARIGRTDRTVTRKLEVIRKVWLEEENPS
jgi:DNA-directed RNA polymerase specialized sigma24 family protein